MGQLEIRALTADDKAAWADLLALSFGRTAAEMGSLLRWLLAGYPVIAWGAWEGDRLAAQYACLLVNLRLPYGDHPLMAGMSLNMSVHPEYRGQGLVKRVAAPVYAAVEEAGASVGFGFSNAEGVKVDRGSRGYGYQVVGQMQPLLAWLPPRQLPPLEIVDVLPPDFDTSMDRAHIRLCTTAQTVAHRYAQHPFRRYRYAVWREGGHIYGVLVFRPLRFGVSLLAAYSPDLHELLRRWSGFVHVLATPQSRVRHALNAVGVCRVLPYTRTPYYLTVKPFAGRTPDALLNFDAWDLVGGDVL